MLEIFQGGGGGGGENNDEWWQVQGGTEVKTTVPLFSLLPEDNRGPACRDGE